VAQALRAREQRARDLAGQPVAARLAVRARREPGRQLGEHRGVAEQLARPEEVEDAPVVDELDAAGVHDPGARLRPGALREDRLAGGEAVDLRARGEPLELVVRQRVERRVRPQERGDLVHRPVPGHASRQPVPASAASISARCSGSGSAGLSRWTRK
jgi:hypothetical protein